jgi:deazaflavin-dependent oxidoreductase (nitroreductase family)
MAGEELQKVASQKLIHVTTTGRGTRKPHSVELWFAVKNGKVYLSHEGSETDWMRNIRHSDRVSFEIGGKNFTGKARLLENGSEEAWEAEVALYEKYYGKAAKEIIEDWFSLSKLIAVEPSGGTVCAHHETHKPDTGHVFSVTRFPDIG